MLKTGERVVVLEDAVSSFLSKAGKEAMAMTAAQELANFDLLMM
ncbi:MULTISPECIES: hypothetical protein [Klebsiella]|uniref:Uncharacterized protein n=1 Tax=Klebsiella pneumoniae subsp. pneumoniae TaxID=72407 RepID=A0ACC7PUZ8_KLEPN|nr:MULTISPECIES: hypothetical protein [Klebsiella]MCQ5451838.1 hypothetical protein [Klebsiella pneumoniae]MCQ5467238.1 hypothetical protein [Klebsiella pneumoniae]MCQ9404885.1 hypothetical protein [Klebsiella pneumoniae]MCQ9453374.1 hypothetical protein [Klebsiella pneumoniae]MCT2428919.1 hypothetical protein [Klebsiella pneumoniae]